MWPEFVPGGHVLHVVPDLLLSGKGPGPVGVLLVRVRVEHAGDVAGTAGIGVIAPGAAEIVGPLEHDEVVEAFPLQCDGHAEAREASADDGDLDAAGGVKSGM